MVVIMEFLDGYEMLDHVLVAAVPNPDTYGQETVMAQALGNIVGTIHATTHSSQITPAQRDAYTHHYRNRALRDVQLEFVFTKAYQEATEAQRTGLTMSADFLAEIAVLKHQYNGDDPDCGYVVSHGDFHPGSVMVDMTTGATKLIDPEFTVRLSLNVCAYVCMVAVAVAVVVASVSTLSVPPDLCQIFD